MLRRAHVEKGSILLVSDLQTAPDDVAELTRTIEDLKSDDVSVHVVPIGALSDGRLLFGRLLGAMPSPRADPVDRQPGAPAQERRQRRSPDRAAHAGRPLLLGARGARALRVAVVHAEAHMRRVAAILGALACFALAAVFLLVALDVARWDQALDAGDVRYRAAPREPDLWQPGQIVPFGAAQSLLGVDDESPSAKRSGRSGWRASPRLSPPTRGSRCGGTRRGR